MTMLQAYAAFATVAVLGLAAEVRRLLDVNAWLRQQRANDRREYMATIEHLKRPTLYSLGGHCRTHYLSPPFPDDEAISN